jgi:hypothetical protein
MQSVRANNLPVKLSIRYYLAIGNLWQNGVQQDTPVREEKEYVDREVMVANDLALFEASK